VDVALEVVRPGRKGLDVVDERPVAGQRAVEDLLAVARVGVDREVVRLGVLVDQDDLEAVVRRDVQLGLVEVLVLGGDLR